MMYAVRVRNQLMDLMKQLLIDSNVEYKSRPNQNVNMAIIHCFGRKIHWQKAKMNPTGKYYRVENGQKIKNSDRVRKNSAWEAKYKENPELWGLNPPPKKVIQAKIHPSSTLALARPPEIIFMKATLNQNNDLFLHHCSVYDDSFENYQKNHEMTM